MGYAVMEKYSFRKTILNNAPSTRRHALRTFLKELRYSCAIFSQKLKTHPGAHYFCAGAQCSLRLAARPAGRSEASDTRTAPFLIFSTVFF
jgi:hypothetical protein